MAIIYFHLKLKWKPQFKPEFKPVKKNNKPLKASV